MEILSLVADAAPRRFTAVTLNDTHQRRLEALVGSWHRHESGHRSIEIVSANACARK
jgi:hypothetical protein